MKSGLLVLLAGLVISMGYAQEEESEQKSDTGWFCAAHCGQIIVPEGATVERVDSVPIDSGSQPFSNPIDALAEMRRKCGSLEVFNGVQSSPSKRPVRLVHADLGSCVHSPPMVGAGK